MIRPNSYHRKKPCNASSRMSAADLLVPTEPICSRCGGPGAILRTRTERHGPRLVRVMAALVCPCCSYENHPIMRAVEHICPHRNRGWQHGLEFSGFASAQDVEASKGGA